MSLKILYLCSALGSLALLAFAAPSGSLLVSNTPATKVTRKAAPQNGQRTVRGHGPAFLFLGGGYRGGK